jgi:uncharacterized membrane protein
MTNRVTESIIVNGSVDHIYSLWANFENFPSFMKYIKSVTKLDDRTSQWTMEGPLGMSISWEVETTTMEKNKRIGWNSKENSGDIKTSGQVTFNGLPQNQTEVTVTLQYVPPAGRTGEIAAKLFSNPEAQLREDLHNFKAYAEGMTERILKK